MTVDIEALAGTIVDIVLDCQGTGHSPHATIEEDLRKALSEAWDESFEKCADQIADDMYPANRNPYEVTT